MKDIRFFTKITALIPAVWAISFLLCIIWGTLHFGHVPVYGHDKLLHGLLFKIIKLISQLSMFIGVFAVPAWALLMIHAIINKIRFSASERFCHLFALGAIVLFFIFKLVLTEQFFWVVD